MTFRSERANLTNFTTNRYISSKVGGGGRGGFNALSVFRRKEIYQLLKEHTSATNIPRKASLKQNDNILAKRFISFRQLSPSSALFPSVVK